MTFEQGIDYNIENGENFFFDQSKATIRILSGPYIDVKYKYGNTFITEETEEDGKLHFQYEILDGGEFPKDYLKEDLDFMVYIGNLLNHLLIKSMEKIDNVETYFTSEPGEKNAS